MSEISETYKNAGVDIEAADKAVDLVKKRIKETYRHYPGKVITDIGGFSALVEMVDGRVMGCATDGVGTKLILAMVMEQHNTVGIDLVAMCVNDLMITGVIPVLFLDYIAMGKQFPEKTQQIVKGIITGCEQAECALVGGEMAEMPGLYQPNDYDLAGFAVGFAPSRDALITGERIQPGMKVYGFPSSGVHSNGFSLIRRVCGINMGDYEESRRILSETPGILAGKSLGKELLTPTMIYVALIKKLLAKYDITGMAHITGGGLSENPHRILPDRCDMKIKLSTWTTPAIFEFIKKKGNITIDEMLRTFNCGIGLVVVSPETIPEGILIGEVIEGNKKVVFLS